MSLDQTGLVKKDTENILEILSGLQADIADLLGYDEKTTKKVKKKTNTAGDVVNISGAGRLWLCQFVNTSSYGVDLYISVDGKTYTCKGWSGSTSNDTFKLGYAALSLIPDVASYTYSYFCLIDESNGVGDSVTEGRVFFSTDPIKFNESLHIWTTGTQSDGFVNVIYDMKN